MGVSDCKSSEIGQKLQKFHGIGSACVSIFFIFVSYLDFRFEKPMVNTP